jgi:CBS-domain-containing membrane protein
MTRDVFTLPAWLSVGEAAWALMHRGVSGAPVSDREGRLVGMISNSDLVDPERGGTTGDEPQTVADIMTPAVLALGPDDTAFEAAQMMVDHGVHRLAVLDGEGGLLGIVTPIDFVRRLLADGHLEARPADIDSDEDELGQHDELSGGGLDRGGGLERGGLERGGLERDRSGQDEHRSGHH